MKKILKLIFLLSMSTGCSNNLSISQTQVPNKSEEDKSFSTKFLFNISINSEVNSIFKKYDRNKNSVLEYNRKKNEPFIEEGVREESKRSWVGWDFYISYNYFTVKHLIIDADKNKDSKLTKEELKNYITTSFDHNKNNQLDRFANFLVDPEYKRYLTSYRETTTSDPDSQYYLEK